MRVKYRDHFLLDAPIVSSRGDNPSGWIKEDHFCDYLKFFVENVRWSKEKCILLVLDNHGSHPSIKRIDYARENGIVVLSFPSHRSHKLRPLDRTVYGPFKNSVNNYSDNWMVNQPGKAITTYDIPGIVKLALPSAASLSNIQSGFRCSGVYPYLQYRTHQFTVSYVTDREFALNN